MISPMTPPGTKVVCVIDSGLVSDGSPAPMRAGDICTVGAWRDASYFYAPEIGGRTAMHRRRFRYLELPRSITSALTSQPLVTEREHEVAL